MTPSSHPRIRTRPPADALGLELAEPTTWFPNGPPAPDAERLAKLILEHRPGALLVFDTR